MEIEIGSEFYRCDENPGQGLEWSKDLDKDAFVFSGRTAIELAIKSILKKKTVRKALLPSYCCDSMIQPFRDRDITVSFYDINYFDERLDIDLKITKEVDVIVWCNYFGFTVPMPSLLDFKNRGGIVIEDITHSLLSKIPYHGQSDYLVASLRKWGQMICGGYCAALNGELLQTDYPSPPSSFIKAKKEAMEMKRDYLFGNGSIQKAEFLSNYHRSNEWLANHYHGLSIDEESRQYILNADLEEHRKIRRVNAHVLYEGISGCTNIKPLFSEDRMDCPLFFPIIVKDGNRNAIHQRLINNNVYCPIHWPRPSDECASNLYNEELSLICDQRYTESDMKRILSVLLS